MGIVGKLGDVLKFGDVDCWGVGGDVGAGRDRKVIRKTRSVAMLDLTRDRVPDNTSLDRGLFQGSVSDIM